MSSGLRVGTKDMFNVVQKALAADLHVNALGVPIAIVLTGGEVSDYKGYLPIMEAEDPAPKVLLADKGYDADFIRDDIQQRSGYAMIPTKRNRLIQLPVDGAIYALRNIIERCFNKLKNARHQQHDMMKLHSAIQASSILYQFVYG